MWDEPLIKSIEQAASIGDADERALVVEAFRAKPSKAEDEQLGAAVIEHRRPSEHRGNAAPHTQSSSSVMPLLDQGGVFTIKDPGEVAETLSYVMHDKPIADQANAIREIMKRAPEIRRPTLLRRIARMAPAAEQVGGAEALRNIERSVQEVASWFP